MKTSELTYEQSMRGRREATNLNKRYGLPNQIPFLQFNTMHDVWQDADFGIGLYFQTMIYQNWEFVFTDEWYSAIDKPAVKKRINNSFKMLKVMLSLGKNMYYVDIRLWRLKNDT